MGYHSTGSEPGYERYRVREIPKIRWRGVVRVEATGSFFLLLLTRERELLQSSPCQPKVRLKVRFDCISIHLFYFDTQSPLWSHLQYSNGQLPEPLVPPKPVQVPTLQA
ncbi:hypothetical protein DdX_21222 [Ditylenchus destructor]|uniref:Uncharacterized protein n=1 Tax=Ditylenchus destructor TaxID=166010 RepID=A0AAD4MGT6_9BILA|nr:hypothetical protein DdX_21222 [Ditylenchus destructor]